MGSGDFCRTEWRPQGKRIGWLEGDDLYLEPDTSFGVAQSVGRRAGDELPVAPQTLRKRLKERRLLRSTDDNRQVLTVRRRVEGRRTDVVHLHRITLSPPEKPDQPDQEPEIDQAETADGRVSEPAGSGSEANPTSDPTSQVAAEASAPSTEAADPEPPSPPLVGLVGFSAGGGPGNGHPNGAWSGDGENPTSDPTTNPTTATVGQAELDLDDDSAAKWYR